MQEIFKSKAFYIALILSMGIIFVGLINFNQVYVSQTNILIIPKNGKVAFSSDQVVENLRSLPFSLSFFDKMIENNSDVADESILELPDYKRKIHWNSKIKINRIKESGILEVITSDNDKYQAEVFNAETIKELLRVSAFYYDAKNDIDFRIVDGPMAKLAYNGNNFILFFESLAGGFILTYFSFFFSFFLFKKRDGSNKIILKNPFEQYKNKKEIQPTEDIPPAITFEEKPWDIPKKTEVISLNKRGVAPDNLPIAIEEEIAVEIPLVQEIVIEEKKEEVEKILPISEIIPQEIPIIREATPEEVKERLNKLLSGKM